MNVYRYDLPRNLRYPTRFPRRRAGGGGPVNLVAGGALAILAAGVAGTPAVIAAVHTHDAPPAATTPAQIRQLAMTMAAAHGWTGPQASCLGWLWTRESGWRMVWNTAGSGAFGIPQALPASKMASAGADYMTNPATEIRWGLGYIEQRYVTPCRAWNHETFFGWY